MGASWVLSATATDKLASWRVFALLLLHFVVRHLNRRKRTVIEACVREEIRFFVLFLYTKGRERGALPDSN